VLAVGILTPIWGFSLAPAGTDELGPFGTRLNHASPPRADREAGLPDPGNKKAPAVTASPLMRQLDFRPLRPTARLGGSKVWDDGRKPR
jgi:hypothetical protein